MGGQLLYIWYWFWHTSTWTCHRCTCVPHPVPPSHIPPCNIPLGHPSPPAPRIVYHESNLDWRFISYMKLYVFQCHSPKSPHPFPQSLLFNMLSRLVKILLPRSKLPLISWLQSPSAVILDPRKINSATVSMFPHLLPMKWWDKMPWSSLSECWALSQLFTLFFHFHQEAL